MKRNYFLILSGILLLAAFMRFFLLHDLPPGLYPDEAANGIDAIGAIDHADFRVFYTTNNGREGFFMNLQGISLQLFGISAWSLRAVSATVGTLTVLAIFLLARELAQRVFYGREDIQWRYALLSAFLLAVAFWHVNFSRIGFRAILLPLFSTLALFFILRAIRTRSTGAFMLSGFFTGMTFHTYIASRIFPVVLVPLFFRDVWKHRGFPLHHLKEWIIFTVTASLVILPLAGYFAANPGDFTGRAGDVSIFAAENPIRAAMSSTVKTAGMFHIYGDNNWRHNAAGDPMLDGLTGVFFLLGITAAPTAVVRRKIGGGVFFLLFVWFAAMLLPAITTREGLPHALRSLGVLPPTILFAAFGGLWLWEYIKGKVPATMKPGLMTGALMLILLLNFHQYFFAWAGNPNVPGAFRQDLTVVATYLNEHADQKRYVIVNEHGIPLDRIPMPVATVRFLTNDTEEITYLTEERITEIVPEFDKTIILTTSPPSPELQTSLQALFPTIKALTIENLNGYTL